MAVDKKPPKVKPAKPVAVEPAFGVVPVANLGRIPERAIEAADEPAPEGPTLSPETIDAVTADLLVVAAEAGAPPSRSHLDAVLACPLDALAVYWAVRDGRIRVAIWRAHGSRTEACTPTGDVLANVFPVDAANRVYGGRVGHLCLFDGPREDVLAKATQAMEAQGYTVLS